MKLDWFGLAIHEADVALTDVALAVLGGVFAQRLGRGEPVPPVRRCGQAMLAGLSAAALLGAVFHAFFPLKTATIAGRFLWAGVATAISLTAAAMLLLAAYLLRPGPAPTARRTAVLAYVVTFIVYATSGDQSYGRIVLFYAPVLVALIGASARAAITLQAPAWWMVVAGLVLSVAAAVVQQARVVLHPQWFDHNALYHVIQAIALVLIWRGLAIAPEPRGADGRDRPEGSR